MTTTTADNDVLFRITEGDNREVYRFAARLVDEFSKRPLLSELSFGGEDEASVGIEASVGDKKGIIRRFRSELVDALMSALSEHVADSSEICMLSDGEVVCLNDLDYQPVTNTEPSKQGGFTRMNIQDPDMPQLEFPEGIDVLRTIYRIDPDKWIPIETQTVCGKTPTPPGWVDLWNYRKALQSLKRDENGVIVEPIEAKFEPDAWQETHTPVG